MTRIGIGGLFAMSVFVGMLVLMEAGLRIGRQRIARDPTITSASFDAIDGAALGLMGLLIAFTFAGASTRFDARRQLIVDEANAIEVAYLRLDVLPAAAQPPLRNEFRQYVDARLAVYRAPDIADMPPGMVRGDSLKHLIWTQAVAATRGADSQAALLLLPALNTMFDMTTTRTVVARTRTPAIIYLLMGIVALLCAVLAGFHMAEARMRSWVHIVGFAAIVALTLYVIIDLENPHVGLIRIDNYNRLLTEVRQSMN
jgi:hypothetical protein